MMICSSDCRLLPICGERFINLGQHLLDLGGGGC
jgi:hypothetical protein